MGAFTNNAITENGRLLLADAQTGGEFVATKIVMGSGYIPSGKTASTMTDVVSPVKNLVINKIERTNDGKVIIGGAFSNEDITTEFYFRELALYAQCVWRDSGGNITKTGEEKLYSYGNAGAAADLIPAYSTSTLVEKQIDLVTYVGNDTIVNLTIESGMYLTVDGDGKDLTVTFAEASTRENIKTGEKLSAVFGKISKFFNDLKTVAFTGSYADLSNKPGSFPPSAHNHAATDINSGTLAIVRGGTGASTAAAARTNLGLDNISDVKTAHFIIGTSASGWTSSNCDYLCDGIDDQVEINNAIKALPASGGEIVILDGTYNITAKINVNKSNVSVRGNGNATRLKRMYNGSGDEGLITITASNSSISKLYFDGNRDNYSTYTGHHAISLLGGTNHIITKNIFVNCEEGGVFVKTSQVIILSNIAINNRHGVRAYYGKEVIINSNKMFSCASGVCGGYSDKLLVTSNFIKDCNSGISLYGGTTASLILGNTCIRGAGTPSDYTSSQYTIEISGDNNLISSNLCLGKAVVIEGGTSNTEVNNKYQ